MFRYRRSLLLSPFNATYPFDAVYVINLKRRQDRWKHMEKQLDSVQLAHPTATRRFEAVEGVGLDPVKLHADGILSNTAIYRIQKEEDKLYGMDLTPGAIGCALSHRKLWNDIMEAGHQCALVLEDDVEFCPKIFPNLFRELWAKVPADWEIVHLAEGFDLVTPTASPTLARPEVIASGVRVGYEGRRDSSGYVISSNTARKLLQLTPRITWQISAHMGCLSFTQTQNDSELLKNGIHRAEPKAYVLQSPTNGDPLISSAIMLGTDVQPFWFMNAQFKSEAVKEGIKKASSIPVIT